MMKPILFNTEEVKAILDDRKSATRRALKRNMDKNIELDADGSMIGVYDRYEGCVRPINDYAPYRIGDILYVRETWCRFSCSGCEGDGHFNCSKEPDKREGCYMYRASDEIWGAYWRPSIHMPKEAARIFLRVTELINTKQKIFQ